MPDAPAPPGPGKAPQGPAAWARAREASIEWWRGERKRPLLALSSPLDPANPPEAWDRWCFTREPERIEESLRRFVGISNGTYHAAEGFPYLNVNFAPGILATFLSGFLQVGDGTVWVEKPHSWDEIERMRLALDDSNPWWARVRRATEGILEASGGAILPSSTDLGGVLDVLAALRGTTELLQDLIDDPDRVKAAARRLVDDWHRSFDLLAAPAISASGGTVNRWGFFAPGRHYPIQCDFAAMISPAMFAEFVLPTLEAQAERLDVVIYHLDGTRQLAHLDILLGMKRLDAVQWVPGAGQAPPFDPKWFPMFRRIQETGRAVVVGNLKADKAERVLREIDPRLVLANPSFRSPAEADAYLETVERLCAR